MSNSSMWPIDRTWSGATTPGQSGPGSNGNEEVLHIPQSSKTRASTSESFVISRTLIGVGFYSYAKIQLVYSTAPADWATSVKKKERKVEKELVFHQYGKLYHHASL